MKKVAKYALWAVVLAFVGYLAAASLVGGPNDVPLSDFVDKALAGKVRTARWQGETITGTMTDGTRYSVRAVDVESKLGYEVFTALEGHGTVVTNTGPSTSTVLLPLLGFLIVPLCFIVVFYYVFIKPAQNAPTSGFSPPRGTPEERLARIDDLHQRGAISDEERARLRDTVLKGL